MVYRIIRNLVLLLLATAPLVGAQVYNQFPPPGMAYTNHLTTNSVVAGGSFNTTGTTVPANGIYLPSANTLGFSANSTLWGNVNSTGNWTIAAPTSGNTLTISSLNASVSPIYTVAQSQGNMIEGSDGTNTGAFLGFDASHNMQMGSISASYGLALYAGANKEIINSNSVNFLTQIALNGNLLVSPTAPTISSGFGTSPSIVSNNGTSSFSVNVGTGGVASSGVINMTGAVTGWACSVSEITSPASDATFQTGSSTTSVTVTNYARTTGVAHAWTASDVLELSCFPN